MHRRAILLAVPLLAVATAIPLAHAQPLPTAKPEEVGLDPARLAAIGRMLGAEVHHSGPPAPGPTLRPTSPARRLIQHAKSMAVVAMRASEELYRLTLAHSLARRGHLVVLDRHPYLDYHRRRVLAEGGWMRWGDRVHALLLKRLYPKPAEIVLLDAVPEVLHARKPEGTLEALRARRQEYLDLADRLPSGMRMSVLDVSGPEDDVAGALLEILEYGRRMAAPTEGRGTTGGG